MKTVYSLAFMVVTLMCSVLVTWNTTQAESLSLGMGNSYLNQTLDGERGPNLLATDLQFRLDRQNIGGTYHARFHNDAVIWQRVTAGLKWRNVEAFYSLDLTHGLFENGVNIGTNTILSGGGLRFTQIQGSGHLISLTGGVYDRGFCAEATCSVERNGFTGRIGYEFRKIQDLRWWGPSVSIGWGW